MIHGILIATNYYMQLTIKQLKMILADNEIQLKLALKTNNIERIIDLMNHRAIVKDCIIESLTNKINLLTKQGVSK